MSARPFIDSMDFARNGSEMSGIVRVEELPRLLEISGDSEGIMSYSIRGGVDKYGVPMLDITIDGSCQLVCQRCLGVMNHVVQINSRLFLRSQVELDVLEDEGEEFDSILAEAQLDVPNLLEEEILLSLPIAPKHELDLCKGSEGGDELVNGNNPFAALAKFKVIN